MVATKAVCQVFGHAAKLVYFGGIVAGTASVDYTMMLLAIIASITGTTVARRFLEAMSDSQFRTWANRIITSISGYYVLQGSYLLIVPLMARWL